MVEEGAARQQRDGLLARVDQVGILLARSRRWAHAEDPVLAVEEDLAIARQVVGDQCGHADAEIDVRPLRNVARHPGRELLAGQALHATTTRWTKIPGVTTASGSSAPTSTTSSTWATVQAAAVAITGPKLRAALR